MESQNGYFVRYGRYNNGGFTLVELIVVITILVILGTIAFLNLSSFSASARDSERTSDLDQINTQIMMTQAKSGTAFQNMLTRNSNNELTAASIAGAASSSGTNYFGGDANYSVLSIDPNKMSDPIAKVVYKMGATTLAG